MKHRACLVFSATLLLFIQDGQAFSHQSNTIIIAGSPKCRRPRHRDDTGTSIGISSTLFVGNNNGDDTSTAQPKTSSGSTFLVLDEGPPPNPFRKPSPPRKKQPNRRMQVFAFLNRPKVEVISALLVLLSAFLVAVNTLDDLPVLPEIQGLTASPITSHVLIEATLGVFNMVFAVEFFVRWYAAGNFKAQYLTKPTALLDIFVVLIPLFAATILPGLEHVFGIPSVLPEAVARFDSTGLRDLLLLRILRLRRVLTDINTFTRFEIALGVKPNDVRPYQLKLARVVLSIFTLLSVASGLIYTTEHGVNPNIPNYFVALYFGLTTLTTVGFGDVSPVTPEGRIVVCLSILAGVAIIPAQAANLVDAIIEFTEERKKGGPRITVTGKSSKRKAAENVVSSTRLRASKMNEAAPTMEDDQQWVGWLGRCCLECEATDHREDASYCWSCGSKL